MNRNDESKTDMDHNARAKVWRELLVIYGVLVCALLWNWLV